MVKEGVRVRVGVSVRVRDWVSGRFRLGIMFRIRAAGTVYKTLFQSLSLLIYQEF